MYIINYQDNKQAIKMNYSSCRKQIENELLNSPQRRYFSPVYLAQYRVTLPLIIRYVYGKLIDLGCGDMPFRDLIKKKVDIYDSLDNFPSSPDVTYQSDIQNMSVIKDETYDCAICLEVLEHIPDVNRALSEINRIIKRGGIIIISVPHLSRLHDQPNDYYRFTKYGIEHLLRANGFEVIELHHKGGIFTFLGHQISTLILCSVWKIPIIKNIVFIINKYLLSILCFSLDNLLDRSGIFAQGYSIVIRKRYE
jgi:SAM-dependent methyltransferase